MAGITADMRQETQHSPDLRAFWGHTVAGALSAFQKATPARVGHRTMIDALIPFTDTPQRTRNLRAAVGAAKKGADATIPMTAKLGR